MVAAARAAGPPYPLPDANRFRASHHYPLGVTRAVLQEACTPALKPFDTDASATEAAELMCESIVQDAAGAQPCSSTLHLAGGTSPDTHVDRCACGVDAVPLQPPQQVAQQSLVQHNSQQDSSFKMAVGGADTIDGAVSTGRLPFLAQLLATTAARQRLCQQHSCGAAISSYNSGPSPAMLRPQMRERFGGAVYRRLWKLALAVGEEQERRQQETHVCHPDSFHGWKKGHEPAIENIQQLRQQRSTSEVDAETIPGQSTLLQFQTPQLVEHGLPAALRPQDAASENFVQASGNATTPGIMQPTDAGLSLDIASASNSTVLSVPNSMDVPCIRQYVEESSAAGCLAVGSDDAQSMVAGRSSNSGLCAQYLRQDSMSVARGAAASIAHDASDCAMGSNVPGFDLIHAVSVTAAPAQFVIEPHPAYLQTDPAEVKPFQVGSRCRPSSLRLLHAAGSPLFCSSSMMDDGEPLPRRG
jgi:hypothetical protein